MVSPTQTMENTTFDFTPSFKKNPDDMPEHVSIYDRPKRGRPKGTCKFSDEERRERARLSSKILRYEY